MENAELIAKFESYPTYKRFVGVLARSRVDPELVLFSVYAAAMESIGGLTPGKKYTTEQLCGKKVWEKWPSDGQHRAMGISMSFLVAVGLVPLVCSSPLYIRNKRYSLKLSVVLISNGHSCVRRDCAIGPTPTGKLMSAKEFSKCKGEFTRISL